MIHKGEKLIIARLIAISGGSSLEKKNVILAVVVVAILVVASVAAVYLIGGNDAPDNVVYYTSMSPGLMDSWLAENETSAYIAWEPYASSAVVAGTGRVLMWTNEIMPHHPCCVVVAWNPFIESDLGGNVTGTNMTLRFMKAHIEATEWIIGALADKDSAEYDQLVDMAEGFTLRSSAVVEEAFNHVKYGYEMNASFQSALRQFTEMYVSAGSVTNASLNALGYDNVTEFVDDYVDESYLAAANSVGPSAAILNPDDPIRLGFLTGDLHQMAQVVALNKSSFGGVSMFEKYGLKVTKLDPFLSGNAEMLAFKAGSVDIGYLGAPPAIQKRVSEQADTRILAQANSEGSALIVAEGSEVHELKDLVGKTVATPGEVSIQHLLLKIALSREGIAFIKG